jgi:serine/threonine protein kinase
VSDKSKSQPSSAEALIGSRLGDYTIERLIGEGGMARVYEATDSKLGRRAAVKVIEVKHGEDDDTTQRFVREARAIASLDHPNIVSVYQFGETPACYYLAMKLIDGRTLLSVMRSFRKQKKYMPPDQIIGIMTEVAAAVDYAHSRNLIHRDIKPSNVMLTPDGHAILMDFGLTMNSVEDNTAGTAFGTPRYIAPEQAIASHRATPQSDIYSLGVVLYEMVTGQTPFDDESPMSLALAHISQLPPDPTTIRADVPAPVRTVLLKALEKRPDDRWETATAMIKALELAYQGIEPDVKLSKAAPPRPEEYAVTVPLKKEKSLPKKTSKASASKALPEPVAAPATDPTVLEQRPSDLAPVKKTRRGVVILLPLTLLVVFIAFIVLRYGLNFPIAGMSGAIATAPAYQPNTVRLIYGDSTFVMVNLTPTTLSLKGVSFKRGDGTTFDASAFGDQTHANFKGGACLMARPSSWDDTNLPGMCSKSLQKSISYNIPFWLMKDKDTTDTFSVVHTDDQGAAQTLKVCSMRVDTCEFALP